MAKNIKEENLRNFIKRTFEESKNGEDLFCEMYCFEKIEMYLWSYEKTHSAKICSFVEDYKLFGCPPKDIFQPISISNLVEKMNHTSISDFVLIESSKQIEKAFEFDDQTVFIILCSKKKHHKFLSFQRVRNCFLVFIEEENEKDIHELLTKFKK